MGLGAAAAARLRRGYGGQARRGSCGGCDGRRRSRRSPRFLPRMLRMARMRKRRERIAGRVGPCEMGTGAREECPDRSAIGAHGSRMSKASLSRRTSRRFVQMPGLEGTPEPLREGATSDGQDKCGSPAGGVRRPKLLTRPRFGWACDVAAAVRRGPCHLRDGQKLFRAQRTLTADFADHADKYSGGVIEGNHAENTISGRAPRKFIPPGGGSAG